MLYTRRRSGVRVPAIYKLQIQSTAKYVCDVIYHEARFVARHDSFPVAGRVGVAGRINAPPGGTSVLLFASHAEVALCSSIRFGVPGNRYHGWVRQRGACGHCVHEVDAGIAVEHSQLAGIGSFRFNEKGGKERKDPRP